MHAHAPEPRRSSLRRRGARGDAPAAAPSTAHTALSAALAAALAALLVSGCGAGATTLPPASAVASSPATAPPASTGPDAAATSGPATTTDPVVHPAPRSAAAITWDAASELVLLFGGATSSGLTNTLEAWDGSAWRRLAVTGERPSPRSDAVLVADPERGVVVLHGGRAGQRVLTDTWEWDGGAWRQAATDGPPARVHGVAAFDRATNLVVLYGGAGEGDTRLTDTWAWDGSAWRQLDVDGIDDRVPAGMAWDAQGERVLILAVDLATALDDGTYASELWARSDSAWEQVAADGPAFSPLQSFVEGPRGPWLIDGGALQGVFSAWEWRGDAWSELDGPEPGPRNGQAVAFDAVRHQLVLFGGFAGNVDFGDTWLLDNGAWREVDPGGS